MTGQISAYGYGDVRRRCCVDIPHDPVLWQIGAVFGVGFS